MERLKNDVRRDIIDKLRDGVGAGSYGCDLHDELCNTDYFIIGSYKSKEWIGEYVFDVIQLIVDWENDNIGEVTTDFSDPERVANLFAYIVGQEILNESKTLERCSALELNDADLAALAAELSGSLVDPLASDFSQALEMLERL